jgi:hypothetical protein
VPAVVEAEGYGMRVHTGDLTPGLLDLAPERSAGSNLEDPRSSEQALPVADAEEEVE